MRNEAATATPHVWCKYGWKMLLEAGVCSLLP